MTLIGAIEKKRQTSSGRPKRRPPNERNPETRGSTKTPTITIKTWTRSTTRQSISSAILTILLLLLLLIISSRADQSRLFEENQLLNLYEYQFGARTRPLQLSATPTPMRQQLTTYPVKRIRRSTTQLPTTTSAPFTDITTLSLEPANQTSSSVINQTNTRPSVLLKQIWSSAEEADQNKLPLPQVSYWDKLYQNYANIKRTGILNNSTNDIDNKSNKSNSFNSIDSDYLLLKSKMDDVSLIPTEVIPDAGADGKKTSPDGDITVINGKLAWPVVEVTSADSLAWPKIGDKQDELTATVLTTTEYPQTDVPGEKKTTIRTLEDALELLEKTNETGNEKKKNQTKTKTKSKDKTTTSQTYVEVTTVYPTHRRKMMTDEERLKAIEMKFGMRVVPTKSSYLEYDNKTTSPGKLKMTFAMTPKTTKTATTAVGPTKKSQKEPKIYSYSLVMPINNTSTVRRNTPKPNSLAAEEEANFFKSEKEIKTRLLVSDVKKKEEERQKKLMEETKKSLEAAKRLMNQLPNIFPSTGKPMKLTSLKSIDEPDLVWDQLKVDQEEEDEKPEKKSTKKKGKDNVKSGSNIKHQTTYTVLMPTTTMPVMKSAKKVQNSVNYTINHNGLGSSHVVVHRDQDEEEPTKKTTQRQHFSDDSRAASYRVNEINFQKEPIQMRPNQFQPQNQLQHVHHLHQLTEDDFLQYPEPSRTPPGPKSGPNRTKPIPRPRQQPKMEFLSQPHIPHQVEFHINEEQHQPQHQQHQPPHPVAPHSSFQPPQQANLYYQPNNPPEPSLVFEKQININHQPQRPTLNHPPIDPTMMAGPAFSDALHVEPDPSPPDIASMFPGHGPTMKQRLHPGQAPRLTIPGPNLASHLQNMNMGPKQRPSQSMPSQQFQHSDVELSMSEPVFPSSGPEHNHHQGPPHQSQEHLELKYPGSGVHLLGPEYSNLGQQLQSLSQKLQEQHQLPQEASHLGQELLGPGPTGHHQMPSGMMNQMQTSQSHSPHPHQQQMSMPMQHSEHYSPPDPIMEEGHPHQGPKRPQWSEALNTEYEMGSPESEYVRNFYAKQNKVFQAPHPPPPPPPQSHPNPYVPVKEVVKLKERPKFTISPVDPQYYVKLKDYKDLHEEHATLPNRMQAIQELIAALSSVGKSIEKLNPIGRKMSKKYKDFVVNIKNNIKNKKGPYANSYPPGEYDSQYEPVEPGDHHAAASEMNGTYVKAPLHMTRDNMTRDQPPQPPLSFDEVKPEPLADDAEDDDDVVKKTFGYRVTVYKTPDDGGKPRVIEEVFGDKYNNDTEGSESTNDHPVTVSSEDGQPIGGEEKGQEEHDQHHSLDRGKVIGIENNNFKKAHKSKLREKQGAAKKKKVSAHDRRASAERTLKEKTQIEFFEREQIVDAAVNSDPSKIGDAHKHGDLKAAGSESGSHPEIAKSPEEALKQGHKFKGWRERGYKIITETEYLSRGAELDKAFKKHEAGKSLQLKDKLNSQFLYGDRNKHFKKLHDVRNFDDNLIDAYGGNYHGNYNPIDHNQDHHNSNHHYNGGGNTVGYGFRIPTEPTEANLIKGEQQNRPYSVQYHHQFIPSLKKNVIDPVEEYHKNFGKLDLNSLSGHTINHNGFQLHLPRLHPKIEDHRYIDDPKSHTELTTVGGGESTTSSPQEVTQPGDDHTDVSTDSHSTDSHSTEAGHTTQAPGHQEENTESPATEAPEKTTEAGDYERQSTTAAVSSTEPGSVNTHEQHINYDIRTKKEEVRHSFGQRITTNKGDKEPTTPSIEDELFSTMKTPPAMNNPKPDDDLKSEKQGQSSQQDYAPYQLIPDPSSLPVSNEDDYNYNYDDMEYSNKKPSEEKRKSVLDRNKDSSEFIEIDSYNGKEMIKNYNKFPYQLADNFSIHHHRQPQVTYDNGILMANNQRDHFGFKINDLEQALRLKLAEEHRKRQREILPSISPDSSLAIDIKEAPNLSTDPPIDLDDPVNGGSQYSWPEDTNRHKRYPKLRLKTASSLNQQKPKYSEFLGQGPDPLAEPPSSWSMPITQLNLNGHRSNQQRIPKSLLSNVGPTSLVPNSFTLSPSVLSQLLQQQNPTAAALSSMSSSQNSYNNYNNYNDNNNYNNNNYNNYNFLRSTLLPMSAASPTITGDHMQLISSNRLPVAVLHPNKMLTLTTSDQLKMNSQVVNQQQQRFKPNGFSVAASAKTLLGHTWARLAPFRRLRLNPWKKISRKESSESVGGESVSRWHLVRSPTTTKSAAAGDSSNRRANNINNQQQVPSQLKMFGAPFESTRILKNNIEQRQLNSDNQQSN